jgi:hypothetical protein
MFNSNIFAATSFVCVQISQMQIEFAVARHIPNQFQVYHSSMLKNRTNNLNKCALPTIESNEYCT